MSEKQTTMLFTHYAEEVGRYLPRQKRKDIQLEILSLLEDALEDHSEALDQSPDEEMAMAVLKTFGPPILFAENYHQDRTLIGPAVFPVFALVSGMVMMVYLVQFVVGLFLPGRWSDLPDMLSGIFYQGLFLFGLLVFGFALLERVVPGDWLRWPFRELKRTWDPAALKPDLKNLAIHPQRLWGESILLLGIGIFMTFFPSWSGVLKFEQAGWQMTDAFMRYLPWFWGYLLLKIGFNLVLARHSFWEVKQQWASLGLKVLSIVLMLVVIFGPLFFKQINSSLPGVSMFSPWDTGVRFFFVLLVFVQFISGVWLLMKIIQQTHRKPLMLEIV